MLLSSFRQILAVGLLCALTAGTWGCASQMSPDKLATAAQALEAAKVAAQAGKWEEALPNFDKALAGGLSVDQYCEALLGRAIARANTGKFDDALVDLEQAERGSPNPEEVYAVRGYVLLKKGDKAGATAAFNEARRINPRVVIPMDATAAGS